MFRLDGKKNQSRFFTLIIKHTVHPRILILHIRSIKFATNEL